MVCSVEWIVFCQLYCRFLVPILISNACYVSPFSILAVLFHSSVCVSLLAVEVATPFVCRGFIRDKVTNLERKDVATLHGMCAVRLIRENRHEENCLSSRLLFPSITVIYARTGMSRFYIPHYYMHHRIIGGKEQIHDTTYCFKTALLQCHAHLSLFGRHNAPRPPTYQEPGLGC